MEIVLWAYFYWEWLQRKGLCPHGLPEIKGVVFLLRREIPENIRMLAEAVLQKERTM